MTVTSILPLASGFCAHPSLYIPFYLAGYPKIPIKEDQNPFFFFFFFKAQQSSFPVTMCIAVISTAHPEYPLVLIDNRDVRYIPPVCFVPDVRCNEPATKILCRNFSTAQPRPQSGGHRRTPTSSALATWPVRCKGHGWASRGKRAG